MPEESHAQVILNTPTKAHLDGHRAVTGWRWLDAEGTAVDAKCLIRWWAQKDSNLQPKDYEAATESSQINDIAVRIVPVTARETIGA